MCVSSSDLYVLFLFSYSNSYNNNSMSQTIWRLNIEIETPDSEVIKLLSCSTQLSMEFILLIYVKMPTIVGILTFISRIKVQHQQGKSLFSVFFLFYKELKFCASLVWA